MGHLGGCSVLVRGRDDKADIWALRLGGNSVDSETH